MVNNATNINIINNCAVVYYVDIGGIVDHHCLEAVVYFVDIGGVVDHHCLGAVVY
jgi:hypothetical protein